MAGKIVESNFQIRDIYEFRIHAHLQIQRETAKLEGKKWHVPSKHGWFFVGWFSLTRKNEYPFQG